MKKILVVDDEQNFCKLLKKNLEITGEFSVETVCDPKVAVESALRMKPDVVLLDVMMPGVSGSILAGLMRERSVLKDTPVIFLTGIISNDEVRRNNNIIGNEYFVAKPVDIPELIAVIKRVCG